MTTAMTTPMMAITVYWRVKEARGPSRIAGRGRPPGALAPGRVGPAGFDPVDSGEPRTVLEGALQLFELLPGALGDQLHRAVIVVADPTLQPQLLSLALDEISEPHALDIPMDDGVQPLHV